MIDFIGSPTKLAWKIHIPREKLEGVASDVARFYSPYMNRKPGRKPRWVDQPTGLLKQIQKQLNEIILKKLPLPDCMKGGVSGRHPLAHPCLHVGREVVVTIDIKDCFQSITRAQVFRVWRHSVNCSPTVAHLLTRLTTYWGHLPTGAPTSTMLANLVLVPVVLEVQSIAQERCIRFSQYIDDGAMSGAQLDDSLILEVVRVFSKHGFRIGRKKVKVRRSGSQQMVTGKVVNKRLSIPREKRRKIRPALHQLSMLQPGSPSYKSSRLSVEGRIRAIQELHPDQSKRLRECLEKFPCVK